MSKKKRKKEENFPSPPYEETSCAVCEKCWLHTETGLCAYGGPYKGYYDIDGNIIED